MFIYFIQCGHECGPIKIGYAANVATRLSKLQNGCPYPLTLLLALQSADAKLDEYRLHDRFAKQRMRGEWFEWSEELVALIEELRGVVYVEWMRNTAKLSRLADLAPKVARQQRKLRAV